MSVHGGLPVRGRFKEPIMPSEEHFHRLERMYHSAPINEYYEPTLTVEEGRARLQFDVRPDFFHAADAVHGSVYFKALDDAAYFAVNSLVEDVLVLTVTFNLELLRPVSSGTLTAEGRVLHSSPRLYAAESELRDAKGRIIGLGRGTFLPSTIPLSPDVGYD
jgi:uncharacterized protein (TIGR00369 family)